MGGGQPGKAGPPVLAWMFTAPAVFGNEGNEKADQFRQPNFAKTDLNVYKITAITERGNFQLRFEFFNLLNCVNLTGFDNNFADINSTFGKATRSNCRGTDKSAPGLPSNGS